MKPIGSGGYFSIQSRQKELRLCRKCCESVGKKGSLITDYAYEKNTYADNQFMKDYLEQQGTFDNGSFLVADGAYSGEANSRIAASHNLKLVTTNFTGRKPDEIYADFKFSDDGHFLLECINGCTPSECTYDSRNDCSVAYFKTEECGSCPYKERCQPRFLKTKVRKEVSWKAVGRAKQLQYMKTEEFSQYARFRNGVEAIPSLLRRRYHVDKIPTHGKNRTRFHFGFKIAALDFQKLLDYINSLDSCVPKPKTV